MIVTMITVEILIAIGVACIATALLAILTDEGDDEAIACRNQLLNEAEGAEGAGTSRALAGSAPPTQKMYLPVQRAGGSKPLFPATDRQ
jgi:hypothetical protein